MSPEQAEIPRYGRRLVRKCETDESPPSAEMADHDYEQDFLRLLPRLHHPAWSDGFMAAEGSAGALIDADVLVGVVNASPLLRLFAPTVVCEHQEAHPDHPDPARSARRKGVSEASSVVA